MSLKVDRGPDFFILGGMKCGTTSLFNYLSQHPDISAPAEKELHYYDIHRYRGMSLGEYCRQFPERGENVLSGEGTPFYLTHPHCPSWVSQDFPQARFIIVMRNPVERFYSHYKQYCKYRNFNGTAQELIEKELALMDSLQAQFTENPQHPVDDLKLYSLLLRGRYAEQISHWLEYFDRDRFLFLFTEHLRTQRREVVNRALGFLGLSPIADMELETLHHTQDYAPMPESLRRFLEEYYAPCNRVLADLLDVALPWKKDFEA